MTCSRCLTGLMVEEWWNQANGARGVDWKCVQCGHRVAAGAESGYTAERPCEKGKQTRWSQVKERYG